jgi:hypothetical protein
MTSNDSTTNHSTTAESGNSGDTAATATDVAMDDGILSILKTIKEASSSRSSFEDRNEYESRLLTFRASTYYAKPACLSPLFCARFG